MKLTAKQGSAKTLADLYRAMDRRHPVTITALKEEKDARGKKTGALVQTVRTLELYDIQTTSEGDVILVGMDRETKSRRAFRLDRLIAYTTHRTCYVVPRETPADAAPATVRPIFRTPAALIAFEIGRDERPAPRKLAPAA